MLQDLSHYLHIQRERQDQTQQLRSSGLSQPSTQKQPRFCWITIDALYTYGSLLKPHKLVRRFLFFISTDWQNTYVQYAY
jgi:hypothetical protein